ncbi:MAG: FkbM family methyltransferase [Silvibacterium sp.]
MTSQTTDRDDLVTIQVPGVASPITFARTDQEGGFWDLFAANEWEPENISLIVRQMAPGRSFIDIGAWIGPLSLIAAKCGARVVALEPDPVAVHFLRLNLELNPDVEGKVTVVPKALSTRDGHASLSSTRLGNSMSSIARKEAETTSVDTIDAREWSNTPDFSSADMLKIDIEGAEFSVLPRLSRAFRRRRPVLLLSIHGYHLRERLPRGPVPWLAHRGASLLGRARLLLATRSYSYRWQWHRGGSEWQSLTLRRSVPFLLSLEEVELVLSDERIRLS